MRGGGSWSGGQLYRETGVLDCALQIPSSWFRPRQADRDWCVADGGASYRGTVATSVTGAKCAPWSDRRRDVNTRTFIGEEYGLEENFCRNHPDFASYVFECEDCEGWEKYQTRTGPWCYSTEEPVPGKEVRMPCARCKKYNMCVCMCMCGHAACVWRAHHAKSSKSLPS